MPLKVIRERILTFRFSMATKFSFTPHLAMILGIVNSTFGPTTINYNVESVKYEVGFEPNQQTQFYTGDIYWHNPN